MTEAKDKPETEAGNTEDAVAALMAEWGEILLKAHRECLLRWAAALERGGLPKLEQHRPAMLSYHLMGWLATQLTAGFGPVSVAGLDRIATAIKARKPGDRTALALELVEEHAKLLQGGDQPEHVAQGLVNSLCLHVHAGFWALDARLDEVVGLLKRYVANPKGRKAAKGQPSKLGANGILVELNNMCDPKPLGSWSFSGRAITAAVSRRRK